eukprot:298367_1
MTFNDNGIEQNKNEARVTIFEPPIYNTIPTNSVAEWNHYSSQKCIIPTDRGNITSLNCTDYGIINFSLHVMAEDCVKCYVHWNGQTIRVLNENIFQILPKLFYPQPTKVNNTLEDWRLMPKLKDSRFEKIYSKFMMV